MLKHLLSVAAAVLLTAGSAMAQQTVFIGETGYDNLSAAIDAVEDEGTITVTGEQVFPGGRITVENKNFTIKGEGDAAKFTRGTGNKTNLFFLFKTSTVTIDGIVFDGGNVEGVTNKMVEVNNNSNVTLSNCEFVNCTNTAVQVKSTTTLSNVTSSNLNLPENTGLVYVGVCDSKFLTISGNSDYSITIEKQFNITAGENLTGNVDLYLTGDKTQVGYVDGLTVVKNCTNPDMFTLANAPKGYILVAKDGNLVLSYTEQVVYNQTQGTYYSSLLSAIVASNVNDVIVILEDIDVTDRINNKEGSDDNRNLTIKGENADNKVVLKRTFKDKLFVTVNGHCIFENLVFDCNNMQNNNFFEFEDNAGNLTLTNVEIINSVSSKGLITAKNGRVVYLTDVKKSNCESLTPDITLIGTARVELNGDNNLSINVIAANTVRVQKNGTLTNEEPIMLTVPEDMELGTSIVSGTTDATKFSLTNSGLKLEAGENDDLVLAKKTSTGIEDVTVSDENAPVEYYNLQGVRISEPAAGQVVIRRQGKSVSKIYVK